MLCSGVHIGRSSKENQAPDKESHPIHQTQELPGSALRLEHELSSINFPRESKRILGSLAERRKPFYGVATAALLPHMAHREVRKIIACICAGKIGFNDSNDLGGPLAKHLNGQNLTYFMDTLDHAVFPESG